MSVDLTRHNDEFEISTSILPPPPPTHCCQIMPKTLKALQWHSHPVTSDSFQSNCQNAFRGADWLVQLAHTSHTSSIEILYLTQVLVFRDAPLRFCKSTPRFSLFFFIHSKLFITRVGGHGFFILFSSGFHLARKPDRWLYFLWPKIRINPH